ncbi:MAG: VTT domain-containing protein [Gammaproteobacteria bacterium]|nr:VTT domain-containing protein [Gammaproteobacteria bacterium]MCZ6854085.1 VTT domain-containing protein [Gammaproteobacteria bacterium]
MDEELRRPNGLGGVKALFLLITIALGWWLLRESELGTQLRDYDWVRERVRESVILGPFLFATVGGACTLIGFPRLLLSALAGFVFGLVPGFLLAWAGTIFGCVLSFYYARLLGRTAVEHRMSQRVREMETLLIKHDFVVSIFMRNLPVGNNALTNLLAGVTGVRPMNYFLGSAIGYIPLTVIFVLVGSGVQEGLASRVWLSIGLFALIVMPLCYLVQRAFKRYAPTSKSAGIEGLDP